MKLNWGSGLVIAIVAFMSFLIFMVYKTTTVTRELVAEDYYAQELAYQQRIDKLENAKSLGESIACTIGSDNIQLAFPETGSSEAIAGTVEFFRPSNSSFDQTHTIEAKPGESQTIALDQLPPGWYHVKIDWESGGVGYYQEERVMIK